MRKGNHTILAVLCGTCCVNYTDRRLEIRNNALNGVKIPYWLEIYLKVFLVKLGYHLG